MDSVILEFSRPATGNVYVTMEYGEKTFLVSISGEQETTKGLDNYQFEEIFSALQEKLYDTTGLPIEEFFSAMANTIPCKITSMVW